jgi:hypothetical protein
MELEFLIHLGWTAVMMLLEKKRQQLSWKSCKIQHHTVFHIPLLKWRTWDFIR